MIENPDVLQQSNINELIKNFEKQKEKRIHFKSLALLSDRTAFKVAIRSPIPKKESEKFVFIQTIEFKIFNLRYFI